jgi:hypothetical protein
MQNQEINEGHYAELLDRVFVAASMIEAHCLNHPLSKQDTDISGKISRALAELAEVYQQIGGKIASKTKY